nr:unnamed protein product [Callosobruchus chinensis]
MDNKLSYSSLNTYRAALNLIIHQSSNDDKILKRFWKGVYNIRPPKPKYQSTWDPQPVLSFLKGLNPLDSLSLELLTKKLIMLLALSSGHKVQTLIEIKISKRIKTSGKNKLQPILILPFIKECPDLCVASVLELYVKKTKSYRCTNCYIILTHKKPIHKGTTQTISRWLKDILKKSGINTEIFCGHSTRHAATSAAFRSGINIDTIRNCAGWTETFDVFHKFYNHPVTENRIEFPKALLRTD